MTELTLLKRIEKNLRLWFTDLEAGPVSVRTQTAMSNDLEKLAKLRKNQAQRKNLVKRYYKAVSYLKANRKKIHPVLVKIARKRLAEVKLKIGA